MGNGWAVPGDDRQTLAETLERPASSADLRRLRSTALSTAPHWFRSNPETGWDDGVFRYHHDAVADEVIIRIEVRRFAFGCDHDAVRDARVLVDDGAVDHAVAPDADARLRRIGVVQFKIVGAHHDAVPDSRAALNHAAYPHYTSLQMRVRDNAAIRNNRLPQGGAVNFASRQKTRMRIDRRLGFEKTVFRHDVREIEIRLVKRANRSDVLPVTFKDKRADMPIFDG